MQKLNASQSEVEKSTGKSASDTNSLAGDRGFVSSTLSLYDNDSAVHLSADIYPRRLYLKKLQWSSSDES